MNDNHLIKKIKNGDEDAAEELIKRYYVPVLRYCKYHCHTVSEAEDLTQETFLRVFRNIPAYKENGSFKSYIYTIARNLCIDEMRMDKLYPLENDEYVEDETSRNLMDNIESQLYVGYLLDSLSFEQRECIMLRFGSQLSFREIAEVTGSNLRTIQSRIRTALKIMRRNIENEKKRIE